MSAANQAEHDAWNGESGRSWTADPDRRDRILAHGPSPVGKLADALPVSRLAVSQHLKVLKEAGLVDEQAEGTRRIYRLNEPGEHDRLDRGAP